MSSEKLLNQKKEALLQKKLRLQSKEKMLLEKTRKMKTKRMIELGEIVTKAGIDHLDAVTLLGALMEIKEISNIADSLNKWSSKGKDFLEKDQKLSLQQLIVSFEKGVSDEAKRILRQHQFKWYPFRKEWYGLGKIEIIEELLKNWDAKIEVVS